MNLQLEHEAGDADGHGSAHPACVAQQDILLEFGELRRVYSLVGQYAEAGVDSVVRVAVVQRVEHDFARAVDARVRLTQAGHAGLDVVVQADDAQRGFGVGHGCGQPLTMGRSTLRSFAVSTARS